MEILFSERDLGTAAICWFTSQMPTVTRLAWEPETHTKSPMQLQDAGELPPALLSVCSGRKLSWEPEPGIGAGLRANHYGSMMIILAIHKKCTHVWLFCF